MEWVMKQPEQRIAVASHGVFIEVRPRFCSGDL